MIKLEQAVIVEGKYDKITLENVIDALIIPTNGFQIFKDKEKCNLIRRLSVDKGIIIMTDSDSAGALIRSYLKKIACNGTIINVYIPQLSGKEKRKAKPCSEGFLGVEGMSPEIIEKALLRSNVIYSNNKRTDNKITKGDMFRLGLSGGKDSSFKRKKLLEYLKLPNNMSSSAMLDIVNTYYSFDEFEKELCNFEQISTKN